ncbi:hypothetical protein [Halobaculum gomorrense]|uniref:Uncharacterized protein n=1 Tax=Halobaculum gomorrense TaxID=43928 RepID=A0A1M5R7L8_9EURY|nr:hypothetical protein [Halobaculum gomorrense]SHH22365.1 hypothetical protein SAMN05443636_2088 [Halobaculum gomorrense]
MTARTDDSDDSEDPEDLEDPVAVGDLRIAVDLEATVDGARIDIRSGDGRIDVETDRVRALRAIGSLREVLPDRVERSLDRVPIGVHVDGVEVARADPDVPAGPLARALGVAPVRLDVRGLALVALRGRW